jgi:tetratricopeptide (TPR) repeat protein
MLSRVPLSKSKKRLLLLLVVPLAAISLWLVGVGIFRQSVPQPIAHASTSQPPANLQTARDYLAQGDYEFDRANFQAAVAAYTHAIALDPSLPEAYNNRAYTYMTQQNYALALPDLDRAIELRPAYTNALMNRGDIHNYYYQIDYDLAVADYDQILANDPDAASHSSLCGHRMLAQHHGWNLGTLGEILTRGTSSGCPFQPAE